MTGVSGTELYVSDGTNVVTRFTTVQISFMNDLPVVDLNGQGAGVDFQTSFDEGGVPVSVSSALSTHKGQEPLQNMPNAECTSTWLKVKMAVLHWPPFGGTA